MSIQFDTTSLAKDFSTTGVKLEGPWENDRNRCYKQLIRDVINECFEVMDTPYVRHHIVYEVPDEIQGALPQEIPSIDTVWFEHTVAKKLWGDRYLKVLSLLACEPVETRDQLMADLYYGRKK